MTPAFPHTTQVGAARGFVHEALLYAGDDGFVVGTAPFILRGVEAGEPVLVVVGVEKIELLRAELGAGAAEVRFADMAEVGTNPARILPAWQAFVDAEWAVGRSVRGVGEPIWAARSPDEIVECQRHEALVNLAFADGPAWSLLCPYDVESLDAGVVDEAKRTHPTFLGDGDRRATSEYRDLVEIARPFDAPLSEPPQDAQGMRFSEQDLTAIRRAVAEQAIGVGLDAGRADDLVLAVDEMATNSIRHGGGEGTLVIWRSDDALICEIRDVGRIADPLVGRERPSPDQTSAFGVWLANQLCDLVQIRTYAGGSVVRLHMKRHR